MLRDNRGLIINDEPSAERQLSIIGYFRLANYMRPMESDKINHIFKPGSTFENAIDLYYFDKELRTLRFTAIQSADISLMNNSLDNLPFVIELSRKTKATIYQNIIIAFSISFIMMVLAATGLVTPIVGAFLHNIGAFIILINSGKITKKK